MWFGEHPYSDTSSKGLKLLPSEDIGPQFSSVRDQDHEDIMEHRGFFVYYRMVGGWNGTPFQQTQDGWNSWFFLEVKRPFHGNDRTLLCPPSSAALFGCSWWELPTLHLKLKPGLNSERLREPKRYREKSKPWASSFVPERSLPSHSMFWFWAQQLLKSSIKDWSEDRGRGTVNPLLKRLQKLGNFA